MSKNTRLSHSAVSKYQVCPKSYEYHYVQRLQSIYKSGALFFGSAVDLGCNALLQGADLKEAEKVFLENWEVGYDVENKKIFLKDNINITYAAADFDKDLLSDEEQASIDFDKFDAINEKKTQVGWANLDGADRQYVNYINWLCLRKKGLLMMEAYQTKLMPYFKEVLAVQKQVSLTTEDGDSILGYIDIIVKLHDGRVAVIDNKTSAMEYEPDSVTKSPQLSLYKTILNDAALDPKNEWKHLIDLAGFAVLSKRIGKNLEKTCKTCGFKAEKGSTHKSCYNTVGTKRCGGEWDRKVEFDVNTQFILDAIPERVQNMILENINSVNDSIKAGIFNRNFNSCKQPWGKCPYYNLCWYGNEEELIQLDKKVDK